MNHKIKLKPLHIKEESIKVPKSIGLSYSIFSKFPFLFNLKKKYVEYKEYFVKFGPITIFVIIATLFILWWINSYQKILPPSEAIAIQTNLINMTSLIFISYLWGTVVKYRRLPIPRNNMF